MAENIEVASFSFDQSKLMDSLTELRGELESQKAETTRVRRAYSDTGKEITTLAKQNSELTKSMSALEKQGKANGKVYQETQKQIEENNKKIDDLTTREQNLIKVLIDEESKLKAVNSQYSETSKVMNSMIKNTTDYSDVTDQLNTVLNSEITSIAEARASNTALLAVRNNLNLTTAEGQEALKLLNERLDENNAFIKENASEYEKQKINIGNYSESIKEAFKDLDLFNGGLGGFIAKSQEAGGTGKLLTSTFNQMKVGIVGVTKASLAFIATPIGAVITVLALAVGALVKYFSSTQEGIDAVTAVTRPLMAVFDSLIGLVQEVGKFMVDAFLNPKKHIEEVYNYVKDKVIRQFGAFKDILFGIVTMDFDQVKKGFSDLGEIVTDVVGDVAKVGQELNNRFTEAYEKGQEIDRLQKEIERNEIDIISLRAETERQLKEQQNISRDTTKSIKEREAAVKETERLTSILVDKENKILDAKIKQLEIQQSLNDTSREDEKELAQLRADRMKNQDKILDNERSNLKLINSIRKEGANDEKKRQDDAQKRAEENYNNTLRRMKEATDLFVAEQGFRARTLQEEYDLNKRIAEDAIKQSKFELDNKKKSLQEHIIDVMNIENELAKQQAELVVENAGVALEEYTRENHSIIEGKKILNKELVDLEIERLNNEEFLRKHYLDTQFEQGLINEREFNNQRLALTDEYLKKQDDLTKQFEAQQRADKLVEMQLAFDEDNELLLQNNANAFELRQQQLQQQNEIELEQLRQKLETEAITQEEYDRRVALASDKLARETAANELQIAEITSNAKADLAKKTFGMLADMAGKESAAGKAFSIAQTTIDTYQSATAAYKAMAGIPIVGPALGIAAAGLAVTSGLMNVKKIASVKEPKIQGFSTGGRVLNGFRINRENGDNRLITAKDGEIVLNENQQRRAGGDSFFRSIGVPGLATGGLVTAGKMDYSSSIDSALNANGFDYELLKEAVREGAKQGSEVGSQQGTQSGFVDLSTNREIENMSSF